MSWPGRILSGPVTQNSTPTCFAPGPYEVPQVVPVFPREVTVRVAASVAIPFGEAELVNTAR
mgnify:CR=1 FL=1